MDFYESIAKYYDVIFPAGKPQLNFLADIAGRPSKTVLDIACGTGEYSMELARLGYSVTALDLDSKMIEHLSAKTKSANLEERVTPIRGNMLTLHQKLSSKYHMSFCIGNSLVHLDGEAEIQKFFKDIKDLLFNGGHLVIQIINFDRVLKHNIKSLPTIEVKEKKLKFHRFYRYDNSINRIFFKTILEVESEVIENEIPLYPLLSGEMEQFLREAGFTHLVLFGDFQRTHFQKDTSYALIAIAS